MSVPEPWASFGALVLGLGFGSCSSSRVELKKSIRTQLDDHTNCVFIKSKRDSTLKNLNIFEKCKTKIKYFALSFSSSQFFLILVVSRECVFSKKNQISKHVTITCLLFRDSTFINEIQFK
jgi:hypothetical protein